MTFEDETEKYRLQAMETIDNMFENFQVVNRDNNEREERLAEMSDENDSLRERIGELETTVQSLTEENEELHAKIEELEAQLNRG